MNPSLLDIVAAYQQAESSRIASAKAVTAASRSAAQRREDHAASLLDAIVTELAPAFERASRSELNPKYPPSYALQKHVFTATSRSYWCSHDHKIMLVISVCCCEGQLPSYSGKAPLHRNSPLGSTNPRNIQTYDPTEFKIWLASYLGLHIARHCA
jgi:hypothetical protein